MAIVLGFEERYVQFPSCWHRDEQHLWGVEEHLLSLKSRLEFVSCSQCLNRSSTLLICLAGRQCWLLCLRKDNRKQIPGINLLSVTLDPSDC